MLMAKKLRVRHLSSRLTLFAVAFAAIGALVAFYAAATTSPNAKTAEAESSTSTSNTTIVSDASASNAAYISLDAVPSSGSSCPNTAHKPGGPDGAGGCWPYDGNTGPAASVTLTNYTGQCTITATTVIDSKNINCSGGIVVKGNLTIRNSNVTGYIDGDYGFPLVIEDSYVNGGNTSAPAIGYANLTIRRSEVVGGQHNILCSDNCIIEDNWLHNQYNQPGGSFHNNAYISNGGNNQRIYHNSLYCSPLDNGTGGGCTADASIFGDFAVMRNVTFDFNLFHATPSGGICGTFGYNTAKPYGNNPANIVVTNNIFQRGPNNKCGVNAPVTSFLQANGNVWSNNKFEDGVDIPPAGD